MTAPVAMMMAQSYGRALPWRGVRCAAGARLYDPHRRQRMTRAFLAALTAGPGDARPLDRALVAPGAARRGAGAVRARGLDVSAGAGALGRAAGGGRDHGDRPGLLIYN